MVDIFRTVLGLIILLSVVGWMWFCIIRSWIRRRREKEELKQRVQDAIADITADGKVEGPKGEYKPKRWAGKWVNYSHSVPPPNFRKLQFPEHPRYPSTMDAD